MERVSLIEYARFLEAYWLDGEYKNQRIGQYFCNRFDVTDDLLFYETEHDKALDRIIEHYTFHDRSD